MRAAAPLADRSAQSFDCPERFIEDSRTGTILFPKSPAAADRNNRMSSARSNCTMALPGVVCAVSTDTVDLRILRDLRQQIGEHRRIAVSVGGDLSNVNVGASASIPIWTLRHWQRWEAPCLRVFHSPYPSS